MAQNQASIDDQRFWYFWNKWWLLAGGDIGHGQSAGREIQGLYQLPVRFYHTSTHLIEMWELLEEHQALAVNPIAIGLAIAGHDAIYDPLATNNEQCSAEFFGTKLLQGGIADQRINDIQQLILVTKDHQPATSDEKLMVDLDLAILGQPPNRYQAYSRAVRQEYALPSDAEFASGRAKFIQAMLDRSDIYHTEPFRSMYEIQARENLRQELHQISV